MMWTKDIVAAWIEEAVETAKALPSDGPAGYRCYWPDIVRSNRDGDRAPADTSLGRRTTTQEALDCYDQVQKWMERIRKRTSVKAIWWWATGASDRWIGRKLRIDHKTVKARRHRAFRKIARWMNEGGE